ncbi:hypothetical protein [Roseibacillus ishigakijimensis]|uniref:Yip1 domain-containing protein n=1 Tax=Roseibacillus ishigakijimensis TaxID=454146 RepID=A0A934RW20_9BACT|nr:hypothetical protein [Roseibacillus ishigakijimensis]MBK1835491.1 hypothetical protein [Roseibacillus ishigakijimensis]
MNSPTPPDLAQNEPNDNPFADLKVTNLSSAIEALLRNPRALFQALRTDRTLILPLLLLALLSAAVLGLVLGTYSGGTQLWAAPLKIAGGLLLAAAICFPSLYIFSCLANSPLRLPGIAASYLCFLALLGLLLIAFAPILWIFTQSSNSLPFVGFLALTVWFLSFTLASGLLRKLTRRQHTAWQLHLWLLIFLVVTLQMSTALRPILGTSPDLLPTEKKFFLTHWLESVNSTSSNNEKTREDSSPGR